MTSDTYKRRWRMRAASAVLLTALMALAGCSDQPDEPAGDAEARSGDTSAEARDDDAGNAGQGSDNQAEAEALAPPDTPEPEIDLTGPVAEIERIYREQKAYRSWVFSHPDPANAERLARITHRDCPCWDADRELVTRYAERHRWWTGGKVELVDFEVVEQASPNFVRLRVTLQRNATARLIDESGEVHSKLGPERRTQEVVMRRGTYEPGESQAARARAPWKVAFIDDLSHEELPREGAE